MFELYTDRARKVVQLAKQEAQKNNFEHIGTEHLLFGLLKEGFGVAHHILESLEVSIGKIRVEAEKLVQAPPDVEVNWDRVDYSPRLKEVFKFAASEALALRHKYIGTEHLLLALLREGKSTAAQILNNLDIDILQTRAALLELLDAYGERHAFKSVYSNTGEKYNVVRMNEVGDELYVGTYDKSHNTLTGLAINDIGEIERLLTACRKFRNE